MSVLCMWLGLPAFFIGLIMVNTAKTRLRYLKAQGKPPDKAYARLNILARVLFAAGFALWLLGAFMTIGAGK